MTNKISASLLSIIVFFLQISFEFICWNQHNMLTIQYNAHANVRMYVYIVRDLPSAKKHFISFYHFGAHWQNHTHTHTHSHTLSIHVCLCVSVPKNIYKHLINNKHIVLQTKTSRLVMSSLCFINVIRIRCAVR